MNDKTRRILAAIVDFYIICFLSTAFVGGVTLGRFDVTPVTIIIYLVLVSLLLLSKDFAFQDASVGKRILRLKIIKTTGTELGRVDIAKRNVSILFLWPVEVLLLIVDNRRIGDIWVKTAVVYNNYNAGIGK